MFGLSKADREMLARVEAKLDSLHVKADAITTENKVHSTIAAEAAELMRIIDVPALRNVVARERKSMAIQLELLDGKP